MSKVLWCCLTQIIVVYYCLHNIHVVVSVISHTLCVSLIDFATGLAVVTAVCAYLNAWHGINCLYGLH